MTYSLLILLELNCKCRHRGLQEVERETLLQEDGPQHHSFWLTSLPLWGWELIICWGLAPTTKYDTHYDRLVCWPDSMELGERHCFAHRAVELHGKGQQSGIQDCLCTPLLMQRAHEDGGASYSPLLIPLVASAREKQTGTFYQLESVEKGCVNHLISAQIWLMEPWSRAGHPSCCTLDLRDH